MMVVVGVPAALLPTLPGPQSWGSASGHPLRVHTLSSAVFIQVCVLRGPLPLGNPHRPPGCGSCPVSSLCVLTMAPAPCSTLSVLKPRGAVQAQRLVTRHFLSRPHLQVSGGTILDATMGLEGGDPMLRATEPRGGQHQPADSVPLLPTGGGAPAPTAGSPGYPGGPLPTPWLARQGLAFFDLQIRTGPDKPSKLLFLKCGSPGEWLSRGRKLGARLRDWQVRWALPRARGGGCILGKEHRTAPPEAHGWRLRPPRTHFSGRHGQAQWCVLGSRCPTCHWLPLLECGPHPCSHARHDCVGTPRALSFS